MAIEHFMSSETVYSYQLEVVQPSYCPSNSWKSRNDKIL